MGNTIPPKPILTSQTQTVASTATLNTYVHSPTDTLNMSATDQWNYSYWNSTDDTAPTDGAFIQQQLNKTFSAFHPLLLKVCRGQASTPQGSNFWSLAVVFWWGHKDENGQPMAGKIPEDEMDEFLVTKGDPASGYRIPHYPTVPSDWKGIDFGQIGDNLNPAQSGAITLIEGTLTGFLAKLNAFPLHQSLFAKVGMSNTPGGSLDVDVCELRLGFIGIVPQWTTNAPSPKGSNQLSLWKADPVITDSSKQSVGMMPDQTPIESEIIARLKAHALHPYGFLTGLQFLVGGNDYQTTEISRQRILFNPGKPPEAKTTQGEVYAPFTGFDNSNGNTWTWVQLTFASNYNPYGPDEFSDVVGLLNVLEPANLGFQAHWTVVDTNPYTEDPSENNQSHSVLWAPSSEPSNQVHHA